MKKIITLLTDFSLKDHYVGAMKGVIYRVNPEALIEDITHEAPKYDIPRGAFILNNAYRYFPKGAIHVVVIDPGVGSSRLPIAVRADGHYFVGPDNGVFSMIYEKSDDIKIVRIENSDYIRDQVSSTFHGRDIFAPAAAHLSLGIGIDELGGPVSAPVKLNFPVPPEHVVSSNEITAEVLYIDDFGNMVTNISSDLFPPGSVMLVDGYQIDGLTKSYNDAPEGELLVLVGSSGYLEISVSRGSAFELLNNKHPVIKIIS